MTLKELMEQSETLQKSLTESITRIKSLSDTKDILQKSIDAGEDVDVDKIKAVEDDSAKEADSAKELKKSLDQINKDLAEAKKQLASVAATAKENTLKDNIETNKELPDRAKFLKSKAGVKAFADFLTKYHGDKTHGALMDAWKDNLNVSTKGVSDPDEVLLPAPVLADIVDAFEKSALVLPFVDQTGFESMKFPINTENGDDGRAHGFKSGTGAKKKEQIVKLVAKKLESDYVYKYLELDRKQVEASTGEQLLRYVTRELSDRVLVEVERAIVVGDGRPATVTQGEVDVANPDKIDTIESVIDAGEGFVSKSVEGDSLYDSLIDADATVTADGDRIVYMNRKTLAGLRKTKNAQGGYIFTNAADLAEQLGVKAIITPSWFPEPVNAGDVKAVEFVGKAYKTVGDTGTDLLTGFALDKNMYQYLSEILIAGALVVPNSGAVITQK